MSLNSTAQNFQVKNYACQLNYLRSITEIKPFVEKIKDSGNYPLKSNPMINTLQVNLGRLCNLSCKHCHVEAGPDRAESMSRSTMLSCLNVLADTDIDTLDITGGAPELNEYLPWFIEEAVKLKRRVIVRTNLTALGLKKYSYLREFYAAHNVEIISSLPYFREKETDRQRGNGVFNTSIQVLQHLNRLGYGREQNSLQLNLVYNPSGAFLPPAQHSVESDFRKELLSRYGVCFNNLFTITNVPIGRFLTFLHESGNLKKYLNRLAGTFNPAAAENLMCRQMISVGWDGQLYDCDFNQMLGLNCTPGHISEFDLAAFKERKIILDNHCYACTSGSGSSCGGALT